MTMQVRLWLATATFAAGLGLVSVSASAVVQGDKEHQEIVKKIADEVKKGNAAGAKKIAEAGAKKFDEVADLMHLYRPRNKGGMGWGSTAGANPATDGLEKKIQEFAKAVPANVAAQVANNVEAANWMAALADLTLAKAPTKDAAGGKTKKAWIGWSEDIKVATNDFAKAAAKKDGAAMQKAASRINTLCVNCHSKFKE